MAGLPPEIVLAPIDSARVVAEVYSMSLLATVPVVAAAGAAAALRWAPAAARALVWRAATLALLVVFGLQLLPARWDAWVVPAGIAEPLIALGRLEVALHSSTSLAGAFPGADAPDGVIVLRALAALYLTGVALVFLPLIGGLRHVSALARGARVVTDATQRRLLLETGASLGIARRVRLLESSAVRVPLTFGIFRPAILLPCGRSAPAPRDRRAVLLHELAHVRAHDVAFRIASRVACALFWFHPGVWWIARRLREECELACDDRVLAGGIRPSEYGRLLLGAREGSGGGVPGLPAARLDGTGLLRRRLDAIVNPRRDLGEPGPRARATCAVAALVVACVLGTVRLAPTRAVLEELMQDARWETRAFAVVGLAPRADTLVVARAAAVADPSPQVRAWARLALSRRGG